MRELNDNRITPITKYIFATTKNPTVKNRIRKFQSCGSPNTRGNFLFWHCNLIICDHCESYKLAKKNELYKRAAAQLTGKLYFFTISPKSCNAEELERHLQYVTDANKKIQYTIRTFFIGGLSRLELTYTAQSDTYKPHYHYILESEKELTENERKEFLNKIASRFYFAYTGRKPENTAITERLNKYGKTELTATADTELTANLQPIEDGTIETVINYCTKKTDLAQNARQIETVLGAIRANTRFFADFGTIRKAKSDANRQKRTDTELTESHADTELLAELALGIEEEDGNVINKATNKEKDTKKTFCLFFIGRAKTIRPGKRPREKPK